MRDRLVLMLGRKTTKQNSELIYYLSIYLFHNNKLPAAAAAAALLLVCYIYRVYRHHNKCVTANFANGYLVNAADI